MNLLNFIIINSRYATVGNRGSEHRRRGRPCREWGSDWGGGGPSDEWEQDSDPGEQL